MSLDEDPARWSDPNSDVPDVLRDLMEAGASEAPSAAKLAALGAKVSASAGGAGAGAGAASALGATKLWLAGVSLGALVLGGAWLYASEPGAPVADREAVTATQDTQESQESEVSEATRPPAPPSLRPITEPLHREARGEQVAAPTQPSPFVESTATDSDEPKGSPNGIEAAEPSVDVGHGERDKPRTARHGREGRTPMGARPSPARAAGSGGAGRVARQDAPAAQVPAKPDSSQTRSQQSAGDDRPSELSLLLDARRSLAKSPARALSLAAEHESRFPESQFAQERDALKIEALTRTGQLDRAREAARRFVRRYPNSAHAHRFREKLEL